MAIRAKTFFGSYTTDVGDVFAYEARIGPTPGGFSWAATVWRDGARCGQPTGTVICPRNVPDDVLEAMTGEVVAISIRDRAGVE